MERRRGVRLSVVWLTVVWLVVASLGMVGCSGAPQPLPTNPSSQGPASTAPPNGASPATGEDPRSQDLLDIRELMAARAEALKTGNRKAFLATTDTADPKFVRTQLTFFRNVTKLPVSSLSYRVSGVWSRPAQVRGRAPALHPDVAENLGLDNITRAPITNSLDLTFVNRGSGWQVAAERVSPTTNDFGGAQGRPWFGGPIQVATSEEVVALTDADGPASADSLLESVQDAIDFDNSVLGLDQPSPVLVDATTNSSVRSLKAATNQEDVGALTTSMYTVDPDGEATDFSGMLIRANPKWVDQLIYDDQTLKHEVTHLLLFDLGGWSPTWLNEGLAEYVATHPDGQSFNLRLVDAEKMLQRRPALVPSDTFGSHPPEDYLTAQCTVTFLARHGGVAKLERLMAAYEREVVGTDVDRATPAVLRQVYSMTEKQVARGTWQVLAELTS